MPKPAHMPRNASSCQLAWNSHFPSSGMRIDPIGYARTKTTDMTMPCAYTRVLLGSPCVSETPLVPELLVLVTAEASTKGLLSAEMLACVKSTLKTPLSSCILIGSLGLDESSESPPLHAAIHMFDPPRFKLLQLLHLTLAIILLSATPDPWMSSTSSLAT